MYISNDCVFPTDWTAETLMKRHRSRPYNPCIANAFFRSGYVEAWGRGVQKICEACEAYGAELPEYEIHSEDIMLKLPALQGEKFTAMTTQTTTQTTQTTTQTTQDTTQTALVLNDGGNKEGDEIILDKFEDLTDADQMLLQLMKEHPEYSQREMAISLGWSRDRVKYYIAKFRKAKIIQHKGTSNSGYWEIKI